MKKLRGVTMEGNQWELAVKPRSGRTKDPYKALACAIVLQAVEDYRKCEKYREEVKRFLLSGFCDFIDLDGEEILKRLEEQVAKKQICKSNKLIIEVYDGASRELLGRYEGFDNAAKAIDKSTYYISYHLKKQQTLSYGYGRKPKFFFKAFRKGETQNVL